MGCKILIAQNTWTGDTVEMKTYCSSGNFTTDSILQDSVAMFNNRYQSVGYIVRSRDSIYKYESQDDLNCEQSKPYKENNYWCICAK